MIDVETYAAAKAYTDSHGGGGGTTNYNALDNKPQINAVELSGNKTAEDLGLVALVVGKGLSTNDYTDEDKAIVGGVTGALAEKADTDDIPDLVSDNLAKGILGNETVLSTDTVPFVSKTMSAGKYQRKKFVGCSFVWNQLVENGDFSDGITGWSGTNATSLSATDNTLSFTATAQNGIARCFSNFIEGHKYFVSADIKISSGVAQLGVMQYVGIPTTKTGVFERVQTIFNATSTGSSSYPRIYDQRESDWDAVQVKNVYKIDLTQLFGSTAIADSIYNLEQATAGAGIAKLKELGFFTEDYYAYDAGSVQSVDIKEYSVTGFNLWDEQWENGTFDTTTGSNRVNSTQIRSKNYIPIKEDTNYYFKGGDWVIFFDIDKKVITDDLPSTARSGNSVLIRSREFKTPKNSAYMRFYCLDSYGTTYKNDICINLSDPARNGQYEPYHKTTYSLTPTELRGVPKIDANNNIYCDGDEYASDGGHTEKYDIVDMGTLEWDYTGSTVLRFQTTLSAIKLTGNNGIPVNAICTKYAVKTWIDVANNGETGIACNGASPFLAVVDSNYTSAEDFKAAMSGKYLVYEKATPTTETLTPFDYPQSVGSLEEIVDYKVEHEDRDVAIPTGHVTEYMGKGGEFTLPTLPETPSVLAFDGHNAYWEENTINLVKAFMNENRRTRRDITNDLANLSQAVAEQNLGKYGYSIGDYFTGASGYTYVLADYNTFRGTVIPTCINSNHLGIVVVMHTLSQWYTDSNVSEVGYAGSTLHSYLTTTVLNTIKTDFIALFGGTTGLEHLKNHTKLFTTALDSWTNSVNQYISALTCTQVDVGSQWTANGRQEGEACKSLELFRKYKWTEIFGGEYPWLRNISNNENSSGGFACYIDQYGVLKGNISVTYDLYTAGLIIFA